MNTVTPQEAVTKLVEGNKRFVSGMRSVEPMLSHLKMADLAKNGQKPFAIVLTCSDSRSPAEMIFDQGVGELFVVRVAGNVVAPSLLASIEFAAANFGSSVVMVLGHTQCGAVKATIQHANAPETPLPSAHLEELVGRIRPAVDACTHRNKLKSGTDEDLLKASTVENVLHSKKLVYEQSAIVRKLVADGQLIVCGAVLDISTGVVTLID